MNESNTAAHEKYQYKPFTGSSHSWALEFLSKQNPNSFLLDIGAGGGAIGKELKDRKFENLYAVEVDPLSREHIRQNYKMVAEDISTYSDKKFDLVLLLDVLEHIVNPQIILREVFKILNSGGHVLISLPNVAHWSVRFPLLFGSFNYKERGILDRTHVNFYTRQSALKFLQSFSEIKVIQNVSTIEPVELLLSEKVYRNPVFEAASQARLKLANLLPGLMAFQNLFLLKKT